MINDIIKEMDKTDLNEGIKQVIDKYVQNKENNFRCNITLFQNNKRHYNKNINKTIYDIREYYNTYVSIIDPEFKKGDNINIAKIVDYIDKNILEKGNKYKDNIIILENGKIKYTESNRRNFKNKIARSTYIYNMYGENLNDIYFSVSAMSRIYEENWNDWLDYLNDKIDKKKIEKI